MSFRFYYHLKHKMMIVEVGNKQYICNDIEVNVSSRTEHKKDEHPTFAMIGECNSFEFFNNKMILR